MRDAVSNAEQDIVKQRVRDQRQWTVDLWAVDLWAEDHWRRKPAGASGITTNPNPTPTMLHSLTHLILAADELIRSAMSSSLGSFWAMFTGVDCTVCPLLSGCPGSVCDFRLGRGSVGSRG